MCSFHVSDSCFGKYSGGLLHYWQQFGIIMCAKQETSTINLQILVVCVYVCVYTSCNKFI